MKLLTKIIDFLWIFNFIVKTSIKKIFFIKKNTPDIYHADKFGFFYNQSDIRYVPATLLWDILKICRVIYLLNKNNFVSIYLRGGISTGNFTKNISDLDLILICDNLDLCKPSVDYIAKNVHFLSKKYIKVDISIINYKDLVNDSIEPKTKLIFNMQSTHIFGKKIKMEGRVSKNNPDLWTFFSSFLINSRQEIVQSLNSLDQYNESERKKVMGQLIKTIVRGSFERIYKFEPIYTKNLIHIIRIYEKTKKSLTDLEKQHIKKCSELVRFLGSDVKDQNDLIRFKSLVFDILNNFSL